MTQRDSVYLIESAGRFKIGKASNVRQRISALQTGNPSPLGLVASFECVDAAKMEKMLHMALEDCRDRGEWFEGREKVIKVFCKAGFAAIKQDMDRYESEARRAKEEYEKAESHLSQAQRRLEEARRKIEELNMAQLGSECQPPSTHPST